MKLRVSGGFPEGGGKGKVLGIALQNGCVTRKTEQIRKTKERESPSEEMEAVIFSTNLFGKAELGISEDGD